MCIWWVCVCVCIPSERKSGSEHVWFSVIWPIFMSLENLTVLILCRRHSPCRKHNGTFFLSGWEETWGWFFPWSWPLGLNSLVPDNSPRPKVKIVSCVKYNSSSCPLVSFFSQFSLNLPAPSHPHKEEPLMLFLCFWFLKLYTYIFNTCSIKLNITKIRPCPFCSFIFIPGT